MDEYSGMSEVEAEKLMQSMRMTEAALDGMILPASFYDLRKLKSGQMKSMLPEVYLKNCRNFGN